MIASGVEMKECVAVVPADEVEWWTNSLKVWGASRFIVKTDHTSVVVPTKEELAKKKAFLIECGLPEVQAAASVATDLPGGFKETAPTSCFCESIHRFRLDKVDLVSHRFYLFAQTRT